MADAPDLSWQQWLTENTEPLAHPIDPGAFDADPAVDDDLDAEWAAAYDPIDEGPSWDPGGAGAAYEQMQVDRYGDVDEVGDDA